MRQWLHEKGSSPNAWCFGDWSPVIRGSGGECLDVWFVGVLLLSVSVVDRVRRVRFMTSMLRSIRRAAPPAPLRRADQGSAVGEDPDHVGPATDLLFNRSCVLLTISAARSRSGTR